MIQHAYAFLDVKDAPAGDALLRFSGIATTPTPDRSGDVLDPLGATFTNPLPLLWHHDKERPIGLVTLHAATTDGITFDAVIPHIEPGPLRDRTVEAAQSVRARFIRAVSIGFRLLDGGLERLKSGAAHIKRFEICELSLVTVPANMFATIQTIKSLDASHRAASGPLPSGVTDVPAPIARRSATPMTAYEQITQFENTRAAKVARMATIMSTATDATLDETKRDEYDGLSTDVKSIDDHLVRARELERLTAASATRIIGDGRTATATYTPVVTIKSNLPKGTAFVRAACAKLVCNGNIYEAAEYAKRWEKETPEVALYLKAAVAPGTVTDATWAAPLVNQNIAADFLELLRPATILGKIPNLRKVPFNTKVPAQTAGGTYGWVGEAKPKPVTKLAFSSESLGISKAAGIIVLTDELVKLSNPDAEDLVRRDMIAGIAQFLDQQFIDPAVAAVAGVNPASITNGAPTAAATTNPLADIMNLIAHFATNMIPVEGLTFIMSAANALSLSFRTFIDGSLMFPGVDIQGGSYKGLTFVTSQAAGSNVIALQPQQILFADDGGVTIDASREASIQMDSAPTSPADATTVYVSLWQMNCVGLRAERFVNWKRANPNAVKYLTAAAYPAPASMGESPEGLAVSKARP